MATSAAIVEYVAHGMYFDSDRESIRPTLPIIEATQARLIQQLEVQPGSGVVNRSLILGAVQDPILGRAVYLEQLIRVTAHPSAARMGAVSGALRSFYLESFAQTDHGRIDLLAGERWSRGLLPEEILILDRAGLVPLTSTTNSGPEYIDECRLAGVPVPDFLLDPEDSDWVNHGSLSFTFLNGFADHDNEIWSWQSTDPPGVCLALPRWRPLDATPAAGTGKTLGFICLGRDTSKACFFDDKFASDPDEELGYPRNEAIPIEELIGGSDLFMTDGGTCTDCHAGENPFVVHPDEPVFHDLVTDQVLRSGMWHDPIVVDMWPQNPGPFPRLGPVGSGQAECTSCHSAEKWGRFPNVSDMRLDGYCNIVTTSLEGAVIPRPPTPPMPPIVIPSTMPPMGNDYGFGGGLSDPMIFVDHSAAIKALCDGSAGTTTVVSTKGPADDPTFVGSPEMLGPIYSCGLSVGVSGVRLGSTVTLYHFGTAVASKSNVRTPGLVEFVLADHSLPPVVDLDKWQATQTVGGVESTLSNEVIAGDYPGPLPVPLFQPMTTHRCATRVAVGHAPGAALTVTRNGMNPTVSSGSSAGWSVANIDAALVTGDELRVRQQLCGAATSYPTPPQMVALDEPPAIRELFIQPLDTDTYEGQEMVVIANVIEGGFVGLESSYDGPFHSFNSWPTPYLGQVDVGGPLGRPLQTNEQLVLSQYLCDVPTNSVTDPALPCASLPHAEISIPEVGARFVRVTQTVPGATVRVWDSIQEIGDGSGETIILERPLVTGETIRVMQTVGTCRASSHFRVTLP